MAWGIGRVGRGQERCSGRLTLKLDIFRRTTRGLARRRQGGSNSWRISAMAWKTDAWRVASAWREYAQPPPLGSTTPLRGSPSHRLSLPCLSQTC